MRKIIILLLTLTLVCSIAVSAQAITPKLNVPNIQIPEIKAVEVELPGDFWFNWFAKHHFRFWFGGA